MVKDEKVTKERFAPGRAFGDFGAKVGLGYLIGLYTKGAHKELTTIRRIRNDFAHQFELNSFDRPDIRGRCENSVAERCARCGAANQQVRQTRGIADDI